MARAPVRTPLSSPCSLAFLPFDPHDARDRPDHVHRPQVMHASGERRVPRLISDDHELSVITVPILADRLNGYLVPGESLRYPREHTRAVGHVQCDVIPGQRLTHGPDRQPRVRGGVRPPGPGE